MAQLAILSIAVIGKQGNPLFLRSYSSRRGGENDLKWHYAAHTALDFFDEREAPTAKTTESYLGLLYAMEDYAVRVNNRSAYFRRVRVNDYRATRYGYQTNTRVKFVVILALADAVIRDVDVKTIFRAIHNAYIAYISNPFTPLPEAETSSMLAAPIRSQKFSKSIDEIAGKTPTSQEV